jgi:hypothetical protein
VIYRVAAPPRLAQLQALVEREPALRERLAELRREHDALAERVDALGIELADAERAWFRNANKVQQLRAEYEAESARLAILVEDERTHAAKVAEVDAAHEELAELTERAGKRLALAEGPLADDYRATSAELGTLLADLALLDAVQLAVDRAHHAVASIVGYKTALETGLFRVVVSAGVDADALRARLRVALPHAVEALGALTEACRAARVLVADFGADDPIVDAVERSRVVRESPAIAKRLEAMSERVAADAAQLKARRAALVRMQSELAARSLA